MSLKPFESEKLKIPEQWREVSAMKMGLDIGQSLTKIAWRREDELFLSKISTFENMEKISEYIDSRKENLSQLNFTGGKCYNLYLKYDKILKASLLNEFEANLRGIEYLFEIQKKKKPYNALLVCLGTGTSIVFQKETPIHLGGSALGGGFFLGLLSLLYQIDDYQMAMDLVKRGNRYNVDLKVADIYDSRDQRVDLLFREFTAASLGKIINGKSSNDYNKEDVIASIISMIAENIGALSVQMAINHDAREIIFFGGFLVDNSVLKNILSLLCKINNKKAIFLKNSEYAGAIGSFLS